MRNNHDDKTIAVRRGNTIVYYKKMSTMRGFWDEHWRSVRRQSLAMLKRSEKGHIGRGTLAAALTRFLPRRGIILEAGCGLGQYVLALRARGYDCRGVDFAEETVSWIQQLYPFAPISRGDILNLPFADGSIAAYLSFGVVEHFEDGPDRALREARRVLVDGGRLILSIPQVFPGRWHRALPETTPIPHGYRFYQYAFSPRNFRARLNGVGFTVIAECGYSSAFDSALSCCSPLRRRFLYCAVLFNYSDWRWIITAFCGRCSPGCACLWRQKLTEYLVSGDERCSVHRSNIA